MTKNVPLSRSLCKLLGHNENFSKGVSAETSHKSSQIHFHITFKTFKMKFQQKKSFLYFKHLPITLLLYSKFDLDFETESYVFQEINFP